MTSGIMGMATNPVAMLLGLGVKVPNTNQAVADEFGKLLGLFPQIASPETALSGEAVSGESPQALSNTQSLGNLTVTIPGDIAQMLGLGALVSPETTNMNLPAGDSESTVLTQAELLTANTGSDQIVYLKFLPTQAGNGTALGAASEKLDTGNSDQGVILPIHLRTVEQNGNQLIADADLLTAAGRDVSIRIRLELSGDLEGNQSLVQNSGAKATEMSEPVPAASRLDLTRLLSDLNVTSLTIERSPEAVAEMPRLTSAATLLGDATPVFRKASGLKITGTTQAEPRKAAALEMPSIISAVTSAKTDSKLARVGPKVESTDSDLTLRLDLTRDLAAVVGDVTANGKEVALENAGLAGKAMSTSSSTAGFNTLPLSSESTMPNATAARFFDLDYKLDQLKANSGQKIRIQLVPAQLGKMELTIVAQRGQVTVNLALDSMQAKQAVEKNLGQLESQLAASGIKVDNFQISVNQSSKNNAFAQYQNAYQQAGFSGQKRGGGSGYQMYTQRQLGELKPAEADFAKVMINCLA